MADKQVTNRRTIPAVCDICTEADKVILRLEMPGVTRENLDIKVDGDLLQIHGKKGYTPVKGAYLLREIKDADYRHEFTLDDTIDHNKIDAALERGVLHLTLNVKESEKPRKIQVTAR